MLPPKARGGSPTGGGNFYIFKSGDKAKREAALSSPASSARRSARREWGIATGYVATRPDAWETEAMKKYVAEFPAAVVARDQLK